MAQTDVEITEVDPGDDAALRAFWDVERAAADADRPHAVVRSFERLVSAVREPSPYARRTLVSARDGGGRVVGVAELRGSLQDNVHLAAVELAVAPDRRREGIGRALVAEVSRRAAEEGRTTLLAETYEVPGRATGGVTFARSLGFEPVHTEDQLMLRLPLGAGARPELAGDADYEVISWGNRCPDEYAAAYCAMVTQMNNDVPLGEIAYEPVVYDEARLRSDESRAVVHFDVLVAVARRRSDGVYGGYSQVYLPHGFDYVIQDDTLVMPEHRGRRLGLRLKLANLDTLARDHPDRTAIHTWTDPENHAMYRTNTGLGFAPVARMYEMQRSL